MTLETDLLLDRRRFKRRLFLWRVVALLEHSGYGPASAEPVVPSLEDCFIHAIREAEEVTGSASVTSSVAAVGAIATAPGAGGSNPGGPTAPAAGDQP